MSDQEKDVIRVADAEASIGTTLRPGMLGVTSDTNKIASKKLSDSSMRFHSDDSKQVLIEGAQNVNGPKTFKAETIFDDRIEIKKQTVYFPTIITSIVDDTLIDISLTSVTLLNMVGTPAINHTAGLTAGAFDNQVCEIWCDSQSAVEIDGAVASSAVIVISGFSKVQLAQYQSARFRWTAGLSEWVLISTNGTLV